MALLSVDIEAYGLGDGFNADEAPDSVIVDAVADDYGPFTNVRPGPATDDDCSLLADGKDGQTYWIRANTVVDEEDGDVISNEIELDVYHLAAHESANRIVTEVLKAARAE